MKNSLFLPIVLSVLFLSSCSPKEAQDNTSQESSAEKIELSTKKATKKIIEAEELISKEEAETLTGLKIVDIEKKEEERVGSKICGYLTEGDVMDRTLLQVAIVQQAFMPKEQPNRPEDIFRTTLENFDDKVVVENIGDEAYIFTPGLHILSDGYYITVSAGNIDKPEVQELIKIAGKLAIENLNKIKKD